MHPELSKRLVRLQLDEALAEPDLFPDRVVLEEWAYPDLYLRFTTVVLRERLLHLDLVNYDFQPAAIEAVDPVTRELLGTDNRLTRDGGQFPNHRLLGRPFLCVTGTRAYYLHESHRPQVTGERWEARRGDFRLVDLIRFAAGKFASGSWR